MVVPTRCRMVSGLDANPGVLYGHQWSWLRNRPIDWRYRFHICLAYFSGLFKDISPQKYGLVWYSTSILGSWNPIDIYVSLLEQKCHTSPDSDDTWWYNEYNSQQRICWVSISGARDWWHENARPEKPEQSWNLAGTFSVGLQSWALGCLLLFSPRLNWRYLPYLA